MAKNSMSHRLFLVGVIIGSLTFLGFAGLLVASISGHPVPPGDRYLVTIFLAIGSGFAAGAWGGSAVMEGQLRVPWLGNSAPRVAATGGTAVMLIILFLGPRVFPIEDGKTPPTVRLDRVTGSSLDGPPRILVIAEFEKTRLPSDYRLFLQVASDPECRQIVDEGMVDSTLDGSMKLFVLGGRERAVCARLVVKNEAGRDVSSTPAQLVKW